MEMKLRWVLLESDEMLRLAGSTYEIRIDVWHDGYTLAVAPLPHAGWDLTCADDDLDRLITHMFGILRGLGLGFDVPEIPPNIVQELKRMQDRIHARTGNIGEF